MSTSDIGFLAEKIVAEHLSSKGYLILDKNWRRKWGELDIVASKAGAVVFVEVKANKSASNFAPELRAGTEKLQKVFRTARTWLAYRKYPPEQEGQIDIVLVTFDKGRGVANIKHFKNVEV